MGGLALAAALVAAASSSCAILDTSGLQAAGGGPAAGDECIEALDCPGLFLDCRQPACTNGYCDTAYMEIGTSCDDDDGKVCDGQGQCVECVDTANCSPGEICQLNLCVPASCGDGILNGDETDLDCGGSCAPCENGRSCVEAVDCQSGYCSSAGMCAPCSSTEDCLSTHWCDAGTCVKRAENGDNCEAAEQCLSGVCPADDGACCDQQCDGLCMACIQGQTGLGPGVCGPVLDGVDFKGECPDEGAASCGANGAGCDGAGDCRLYPNGTQCGGGMCQGGDEHLPDTCDGARNCNDGGIRICSPYLCSGSNCLTSCSGDQDCLAGSYCDSPPAGSCISQGGLGDPCGGNNECDTNFCVDGRCCESACTGECMACNDSLTGLGHGNCRSVPTGTAQPECTNGACFRINVTTGECRLNVGQPCPGGDSDCLNVTCRDGYCCENTCSGICVSCNGNYTSGSHGQCRDVVHNQDPRGDCTHECDGFGSCEGEIGDACPPVAVCDSGQCVDGYCCNISCTAPCHSCDGAYTSSSTGVCAPVDRNQDPDGECGPVECDGTGDCEGEIGDPCPPAICDSNYCEDGYCCSTSCGTCRDCGMPGSEGVCRDMDPFSTDSSCFGSNVCSGGGSCVDRCGLQPTPPGGGCPSECDTCSPTTCTIFCDQNDECRNQTIDCPTGFACVVECTDVSSCEGANIYCPDDYACSITCTDEQSCQFATIYCASRGTCNLDCIDMGGSRQCEYATLDCRNSDCVATCQGVNHFPDVNCNGSWGCACTGCP